MAYEVTDFDAQVIERSRVVPVLVDFWAAWCGPCQMLGPILERLADDAGGKWDLVKVDTEAHQALAAQYRIRSLPTIKLFVDGVIVDEFLGALPESEILNFLKKHLKSPEVPQIAQAKAALESGKAHLVPDLLEPLAEKDDEVWFLLAQGFLASDVHRVAEACGRIGYDSEFADRSNALEKLAALVNAAHLMPEAPVRDRFREGIEAVQRHEFANAFEAFLEVIEKDRNYADQSAVEACKVIFQFLTIRHPVAETFHSRFSALVYS